MRFRVWFRLWVLSFLRLLDIGFKKKKTDRQREKEREKRLKAKSSRKRRFTEEKNRSRKSSLRVLHERVVGASLEFIAITLAVLLLPFGLFGSGVKNVKKKRRKKRLAASRETTVKSSGNDEKIDTDADIMLKKRRKIRSESPPDDEISSTSAGADDERGFDPEKAGSDRNHNFLTAFPDASVTEFDESIPKSSPKNKNDGYIRKRMWIADVTEAKSETFDSLKVGVYFDIEPDSHNPCDKNAVKLTYNGQRIGSIAPEDRMPFLTCLSLGKTVYGVITEINKDTVPPRYEFETWFDKG